MGGWGGGVEQMSECISVADAAVAFVGMPWRCEVRYMSKYDMNLRMGVNEFGMGVNYTATKGKYG